MSPRKKSHPGALLRDLLVKQKIGVRTLARAMSQLPGSKGLDTERRNITRWTGEHNRPRDEQAERIVEGLKKLGVIVPADYFKTVEKRSANQQRLDKAAAAYVRRLEKRIEELERRSS